MEGGMLDDGWMMDDGWMLDDGWMDGCWIDGWTNRCTERQ